MKEKVSLVAITEDSATILKQECVVENGVEYGINKLPTAIGYINDENGRKQFKEDYPKYYEALRLTVWGTEPTVKSEV